VVATTLIIDFDPERVRNKLEMASECLSPQAIETIGTERMTGTGMELLLEILDEIDDEEAPVARFVLRSFQLGEGVGLGGASVEPSCE